MSVTEYCVDLIAGNDVTPAQEEFINHWSQTYFGSVGVSRGLATAPVHWRLILRSGETFLSQVAVTKLELTMDGENRLAGAIGGLFTPEPLQKKGYANSLMDAAESLIFKQLRLPFGILFCLPNLVPFYARRSWSLVANPVTLQQKSGVATWEAATMVLFPDKLPSTHHSIHIPFQKG